MSLEREIGELTAKVERLEKDVSDMKDDIRSMLSFMEQARGSWKTMMGIAGFAAAVGALVAKILPVWPFK